MLVVMLLAAAAILVAVVIVASGHGGEMARQRPDYAPPDLGPVTSADVAMLRPPSAAWGYNMRITDEALEHIARAMKERDVQIAALQQQVTDLRGSQRANPARRAPGHLEPGVPRAVPEPAVRGWERADRTQADREQWARRDQERQARIGQARPGGGQAWRDQAGQGQPGQEGQAGQGRTGQGQARQGQARQSQPGQGEQAGQNQTGWGSAAGEGPVLRDRIVPQHTAMRSPSGGAGAQGGRARHAPQAPGQQEPLGSPGPQEHGEEPGETMPPTG